MMLVCIAALAVGAPPANIADFYPMQPGARWEFEATQNNQKFVMIEEAGAAVPIKGRDAVPKTTTIQGSPIAREYCRIDGDTVYTVAYDPKRPLPTPMPLLKIGPGKTKWEFVGPTDFMSTPANMNMKAESELKGRRKVLGAEREVLEARYDVSVEVGNGIFLTRKQTALYAKGLGLCELIDESTINRKTTRRKTVLTKYVPPAPAR